jgi:hypothetical protein
MRSDDFADDDIGGNVNLDVLSGEEADVINNEQVSGIGHGDVKSIAHEPKGNRLIFVHDIEGDKRCDFLRDVEFGYVHLGAVELLGYKIQENVFTDHAELYHGRSDAFSGLLLFVECAVDLLDREQAFFDQQFAYFLGQSSILQSGSCKSRTGPILQSLKSAEICLDPEWNSPDIPRSIMKYILNTV